MVELPMDFRAAITGLVAANAIVIFVYEQILVQRIAFCLNLVQRRLERAEYKEELSKL
jgi:hypothetical protein